MDLLVTNPLTGRVTGLTRTVRKALGAMRRAQIPYCVVGATALAVRGLPRMTRDLALVVMVDERNVPSARSKERSCGRRLRSVLLAIQSR